MDLINHAWASNAMHCCVNRIRELSEDGKYSWAHYRIERERDSLTALMELHWAHRDRQH